MIAAVLTLLCKVDVSTAVSADICAFTCKEDEYVLRLPAMLSITDTKETCFVVTPIADSIAIRKLAWVITLEVKLAFEIGRKT